jgi:hypothetical protein
MEKSVMKNIEMAVLDFYEVFPTMPELLAEGNYLVYRVKIGKEMTSVVDFTRQLPNNKKEYLKTAVESFNEILKYEGEWNC